MTRIYKEAPQTNALYFLFYFIFFGPALWEPCQYIFTPMIESPHHGTHRNQGLHGVRRILGSILLPDMCASKDPTETISIYMTRQQTHSQFLF